MATVIQDEHAYAGEVVLRGSRHPCVEAQEGVEFIKNDCELVRGSSWFLIITGPNMGGKSTFIRQVCAQGVSSAATHAVPARECHTIWYHTPGFHTLWPALAAVPWPAVTKSTHTFKTVH